MTEHDTGPEGEAYLRRALATQQTTDGLDPDRLIERGRRRRNRQRLQIAGGVCGLLVIASAVGIGVQASQGNSANTSAAPADTSQFPTRAGAQPPAAEQESAPQSAPQEGASATEPGPARTAARGQEIVPGHTLTWDDQQWCISNTEQGESCRDWGPGAVGYRHETADGTVLVISLPTGYRKAAVIAPDGSRAPAEIWDVPGRPQAHLVSAVVSPRLGSVPVQLEVVDSAGETRTLTIN